MTQKSKSWLVNAITFARVPFVLLWMVLAIFQELAYDAKYGAVSITLAVLSSLMMLFSGLTDAWDGMLARKWKVVTNLGKMSDPLMDKVFYIVAFPVLAWQVTRQGESDVHAMVMVVFTVIYMLRDTWVTFMRSVGSMYNADVAAMMIGKVRTALSFPGAGWIYVYLAFHRMFPESWGGPWLASCYAVEALLLLLTFWSLCVYTRVYWPYMKMAMTKF